MAHEFPGVRLTQRLHTSRRSIVDRAVRLSDGATVIVKQRADDVLAVEGIRRIQDEYDMMRSLQGAGVAGVLALVRDGGHTALVLEDLGDVLATRIAERRFTLDEALDV